MRSDWRKYHQLTRHRLPSSLLVKALPYVEKKDAALDLGAGALKDSKFLVNQGFKKVIAVDRENTPEELREGLPIDVFSFVQCSFDTFQFPESKFDLISAQFSLPFNSPKTFSEVWSGVKRSLAPGGVFAGQFFGAKDEWNKPESNMTFHTKDQVLGLFSGLETLEFHEEEKDGSLADGRAKRWHIFHIIARRK